MMSSYLCGLAVCCLVAVVTAIPEKCHIPDEDWEELATQFLAKIPAEHVFPHAAGDSRKHDWIPGFTLGELTMTGLSNLARYGTVKAYCKEGKPHVSVNLLARSPLKMSVPWKYCGGKSGVVSTQANVIKLCIGFDVEEIDGKVAIRPTRVSPKWIESVDVKLDGAGDVMKTTTSIVGKLLTPFVKDFWIENLPWRMQKMLAGI